MSYVLSNEEANQVLGELRKTYKVYAPKRFTKAGRYSDTDIIRYGEISTVEEIVFDEKSTFPAKEVLGPIQQAIFFFNEAEFHEAKGSDSKPILLLGRPCDINAQKIQARIYLGNGNFDDPYYKRFHDRVKFVMMECQGGTDTCFCVSMKTNKTDDYVMAFRMDETGVKVEVKDNEFDTYFKDEKTCDFTPSFVEKNEIHVEPVKIPNKEVLNKLKAHDMWREFDKRCISCGACTVACSTCTCFTTRDITYTENAEVGERRRVTASCQISGFDQMAGQREMRSKAGDRMRYKVLHKFYGYDERFHEGHMCVGCGRCIDRCPEFISIATTVEKMNKALNEIMSEDSSEK